MKWFLRKYIPFELMMKAVALLLLNPLINGCISLYLNSRGQSIAYNYDLLWGFLTVPGLIALALVVLTMLLFAAFEAGVTLLLLRDARDRVNRPLAGVMTEAVSRLRVLFSPALPLSAVYFLLLLPFERMGYLNSLLPRVEIPAFVLGELQLTHAGVALILAFHALVLAAFYLLIFVPIRMLLGQERFCAACRGSAQIHRALGRKRELRLLAAFLIYWYVQYLVEHNLGSALLEMGDFGIPMLRQALVSAETRRMIGTTALHALLSTALGALFISYLLRLCEGFPVLRAEVPASARIHRGLTRAAGTVLSLRKRRAARWFAAIAALAIAAAIWAKPVALIHKPWIIGHRGDIYAPENSVEGILSADRFGADYAEIDVQLSKDGVPVVVHDENLLRLTGMDADVDDLSAAELMQIETSSFRGTAAIPTLQQAIEAAQSAPNGIGLLIELKPAAGQAREMTDRVVETVEALGFAERAIYMSMDKEAVAYLQSIRPQYWIGYCAFGALGMPDLNPNADFLAVEESMASSRFLNIARSVDLPVYVWSVSNMDKMRKYLASGASGIIGDCVEDIADVAGPYRDRIPDYEYYYPGEGYPKRGEDGEYVGNA